jgi:hypothetical protein
MKDFGEIFKLGQGYFHPRGNQITRDEFLLDVRQMRLPFQEYESCKYTLIAMFGLKTSN